MSFESTASYYHIINKAVNKSLGGLHSAKIILNSVDFEEIVKLQKIGDWQQAGEVLANQAIKIEKAGADFLLICTNTMHKVATQIQAKINIPIINVVDAVAEVLQANNISKIGLLGTQFTMKQDFYKNLLLEKHQVKTIIPDGPQQEFVSAVIFSELCHGVVNTKSKQKYLDICNQLHQNGAEAIVLGCTEISLLIQQSDTSIPLYDTTKIHALKAVELALGG